MEQKDQTLFPGFIYIYIIIYLQYVQYVRQKIEFYIVYFFKEKSMPLGSPHLRLLLTRILQKVLL